MFDVFIMDMGGNDANVEDLTQRFPHARVVRYYDNHLDTLKRCISRCRTPYAWIISSCCDYTDFNFDYRAKPWEAYQIHCWASGNQQFGDTFLVNVAEFNKQADIELLEWYKDINWHSDGVPRLPWPKIKYTTDNLIEVVKDAHFNTSYLMFVLEHHNSSVDYDPALWSQKTRKIHSFSTGNSLVLVPKDAQSHIDTQLYDYPYLDKQKIFKDPEQDVIFISNGESMANDNWYKLKKLCPRAKHSEGITGREAAYKAAAKLSSTPWFFAVFAKTEVLSSFDFTFQPDYFQEPKHYIFHSRNPLNGLEYGAMNINLYNKQLVLETQPGLDFTLSAKHTVIPICASISRFNTDPWITWRSAFREVLKLKLEVDTENRPEIAHRLNVWCTTADGENAEYCLAGSRDALRYYEQVNGDYEKLKLSFDWAWLQDYYYRLYQSKPWLEVV